MVDSYYYNQSENRAVIFIVLCLKINLVQRTLKSDNETLDENVIHYLCWWDFNSADVIFPIFASIRRTN